MRRRTPEALQLRPIDDEAKNGLSCLVGDGSQFAVARWDESTAGWVFPAATGMPLDFVPIGYRRPGDDA